MINLLSGRYQKRASWLFFWLFYIELVLPNVVQVYAQPVRVYQSFGGKPMIQQALDKTADAAIPHRETGPAGLHNEKQVDHGYFKPFIGGPGQPEMSSFKSVNAGDMVDLFSGDFSYNIPLLDVGGYPVNIHYNSNVSMDQEASWVGLGWNINPGTISRSVRGLPDDFNGRDTISKTQSVKPNRTIGVNPGIDAELVGLPLNVGAHIGIFHNTYNGWGFENGVNASISGGSKSFGTLSAGLALSSNTQTGVGVYPSISYTLAKADEDIRGSGTLGLSTGFNSRTGLTALQLNASVRLQQHLVDDQYSYGVSTNFPSGVISFAVPNYTPSITMPYTSTHFSFRAKVGGEAVVFHPSGMIEGYVSNQQIEEADKVQKVPAVGYLYYSRSNGDNATLQDYNREKETQFNQRTTPVISIPQYTYDVYSISGEGTGGMFRPYRGDMGFVRDYAVRSKNKSDRFSLDVGFGQTFHGGVDYSYTTSFSENRLWQGNNLLNGAMGFRDNDSTYEAVYFRNPGEKTSNSGAWYQAVGDDDLIRVGLSGSGEQIGADGSFNRYENGRLKGVLPVGAGMVKPKRDKRTQVISYLTAEEATKYGYGQSIPSYKENWIPGIHCTDSVRSIPRIDNVVRKPHHLSQITVLNGDGRRYEYGIAAYNVEQKDVTFSVAKANIDEALGLVTYTPGSDNSKDNSQGKEGLFTKDSMPAYAHSFLLTGIYSPDYVDIKNDGITQDDMGDAIKFNYTQVYGDKGTYFEWRTPYQTNKANYNEGLKTYNRDDKGTYLYGKKEVWYLNSVESKTMVAVFQVASDRQDVYSVNGENGDIDFTRGLRRLDKIDLYTKADLVKHGGEAKPIKTVHFAYSYRLCKGVAGDAAKGKLTLDSIWFSYNGNEKGRRNPYVFRYHQDISSYNPSYQPKHYDRWGNYKDPATNPGGLSNADYPYAQQDSALAARYAGAWTLDDIQLPSGGKIKVTYEADDYAYVQNKRATQFFKIAGLGSGPSSTPAPVLYSGGDYDYVFVNAPVPLTGRADIFNRFLEGNDYIYFKLFVQMPGGTGHEFVPVYAQVLDYGMVPGSTRQFWIQLTPVDGQGALARSAIQFLRMNLPSKAYNQSEPGDNITFGDAVRIVAASFTNVRDELKDYGNLARQKHYCQIIDTARSFVRLNSPTYKKYGGGHRVKKIEVLDNWNHMTGQRESLYGQVYQYTTSQVVNGKEVVMSSGVASYEPAIGGEENPFRQPLPYAERIAPMAPVNYLFVETPLGESYFPGAMVGYSKVRVRTINGKNVKARSANGWQETEFYTTRDFPTLVENTILDETAKKIYQPKLSNFLRINAKNHITLSQGFKIELNDMNGKVKAQSSYAETDSLTPVSYVRNFYRVDNDTAYQKHLSNTVLVVDSLNGHVARGTVGKDIEVVQDLREQLSKTISGDYGVNVDYSQWAIFPLIVPSFIPLPQREEVRFRSAATVKIIQRYGILDSVSAMDKGSLVSTRNLVFDGETGEVVLSRTNNAFNDSVYHFNYPAHWAYSGMGMAYQNTGTELKGLKLINGKLYYGGSRTDAFPVERFFESGDEVWVDGLRRQVDPLNCLQFGYSLFNLSLKRLLPRKAWVVDAAKGELSRGLYFIDENGLPLTGVVNTLRILRSGKRNLLDASVGSVVSLTNPMVADGQGGWYIRYDSTSKVVNTSAVRYKDLWAVKNSYYAYDSCYTKVDTVPGIVLRPTNSMLMRQYAKNGSSQPLAPANVVGDPHFIAGLHNFRNCGNITLNCTRTRTYRVKSILQFNLDTIPDNAQILSATLSLYGLQIKGTWNNNDPDNLNWDAYTKAQYVRGGNLQGRTNSAFLKNVTSTWNEYTGWDNVSLGTTRVEMSASSDASCTDKALNVAPLVSEALTLPGRSYGMMLQLADDNHASKDEELRVQSFCAGSRNEMLARMAFAEPSCDACTQPLLTVSYTYSKDTCVQVCRSYINDTLLNPYRWGILGNWRVDKSFTFYGDRQEGDASVTQTNIRKEGTLKRYSPYWSFLSTGLAERPDTTLWVWNSRTTAFNLKGLEIENHDPLGRYNAGLYGYQQSLPVAVAQNARYREVLYDGFEDYGYQTKECVNCPAPREFDFVKGNAGVAIDSLQSHTGRYSLKINSGYAPAVTVPVISALQDSLPALTLRVDSTAVYTEVVVGSGQGLTGYYTGVPSGQCGSNGWVNQTFTDSVVQGPIDYHWGSSAPRTGMCPGWYTVSWKGKLQAPATDDYRLYARSDQAVVVRLNGTTVLKSLHPNVLSLGKVMHLQAGALYTIEVSYMHTSGTDAKVSLLWSRALLDSIQVIPQRFLYRNFMTASDTVGSVARNVHHYCIALQNPKGQHILHPGFSPLQNSKLFVSAWVRLDGDDCQTAPAPDSVVAVRLTNIWNGETVQYLVKTGTRIEGWQRYEAVVPVGDNIVQLKVGAQAPTGRNLYVDDIRVQPFNSALKGYVYDPVTLRLMAELDENNYATYYEYDDDGTLIRLKKETERGVMTVKETRSALLKN